MMLDVYKPARFSLAVDVAVGSPVVAREEPVTVEFVQAHTVLTDADDLDLLATYIKQARGLVELATARALVAQNRILYLDGFPRCSTAVIELPGGHCGEVSAITYVDEDGAEQTLSTDAYEVDLTDRWGNARIGVAYGVDWPQYRAHGLPVTISYVAGWASPDLVPEELKMAVAMAAAELYEHRYASRPSGLETSPWFKVATHAWRTRFVA